MCWRISWTAAWAASRPRAWAVSSTPSPRWSGSGRSEAAIELEGISFPLEGEGTGYSFELRSGDQTADVLADAAPVVRAVVEDVLSGEPAELIGACFHASVAALVTSLARSARNEHGLRTVALGGGVFSNALLLSDARRRLQSDGFTVLAPRRLPPNDGAIAFGQLLVATSGR